MLRMAEHVLRRNDFCLQNLLAVIDVVEEGVERPDPLLQSGFESLSFDRRDDARNDVAGDGSLGAGFFAVDRKGDADAMEQCVGLGTLLRELLERRRRQPFGNALVMHGECAVIRVHLVVRCVFQQYVLSI